MTCGWLPYAAQPANRKCPITAGSSIGLQWHHQSSAPTDDIVDPTHIGPVIVYMARSDTGAGNVWFKIYEAGYDASSKMWAVNKLINNKGRVDITIPSDIAPGNYLLRGEILALHGAYSPDGVQPYVGCVELTIAGTGTSTPTGVAFPGYYKDTDAGMLFNLYQPYSAYTIPGPPLYSGARASSTTGASSPSTPAPTLAPTTAAATVAPTVAPSSTTSASTGGTIKLAMNEGTGTWWFGVAILGASETTVKVEFTDSGSVSTWATLTELSYGFVYDKHVQLVAPFSLRLTSSTGKIITLPNVFRAISLAVVDTGVNYGSGSSTPTVAPTKAPASTTGTKAPVSTTGTTGTKAPSSTTGTALSGGSDTKVTVHQSTNWWWFSVVVSYPGSIATVEFKDSGSVSTYKAMTNNGWGYSYSPSGVQLVAPFSVRVTSSAGKQVVASIPSITPNQVVDAGKL